MAPYTFFTSYADNVAYRELLDSFHTDLTNELAIRAGRAAEKYGFLARRDIPLGSQWEEELQSAACTTSVMVALLSDDYFRSRWCGWEWAVFTERMRRATPVGGRPPRAILPVTWVPLRATVPDEARALQLTSATLGQAYAGSCVVDLMRLRPGAYQGVVIALAEEVLRTASPPLPPLDLRVVATLRPAFGFAAAQAGAAAAPTGAGTASTAAGSASPSSSPSSGIAATSPPAAAGKDSKDSTVATSSAGGATGATPPAAAPATTAASAGPRTSSGSPPGGRVTSQDLLDLVGALERIEFLRDPWTRRMWVTEIGERSGRVPRLPETPYLRSYFISLVRFASRQTSPEVLDAMADALDLFDPGADGVADVHAIVGRLRW